MLWIAVPGNLTSALPPSTVFWREEALSRRQTLCGFWGMVYIALVLCGVVGKQRKPEHFNSPFPLSPVAYKGQRQTYQGRRKQCPCFYDFSTILNWCYQQILIDHTLKTVFGNIYRTVISWTLSFRCCFKPHSTIWDIFSWCCYFFPLLSL